MVAGGWSNLTQLQLRALLRSHGQPTDGSKAALVQRLAAFLSDDGRGVAGDESQCESGPSTSEAAALEAAGANTELEGWRVATTRLHEQRTAAKAAVAIARAALHLHRVQHNEQTCQLLQLVAHDDLRPTFMRAEVWGVVGLWRLRGVCRAFRGWARAELSSLPRVVAVGGLDAYASASSSAESLDLSTMRWSVAGCMPSLPDPRAAHSVSCSADGRVVVCCGYNAGRADEMDHLMGTALQWLPGTGAWSALPDLPAGRTSAASVGLLDGRTMVIGGYDDQAEKPLASVLALAADGSGWSDLPPLMTARNRPAAALLPDGKVLVAGGQSGAANDTIFNTAELWDPATQKWTALPPMAHERTGAAACVLPSGRVAVVGGKRADDYVRNDGEVFDPVKREWEPLGAEMAHDHINISAVAAAGGMLVVSVDEDDDPNELYDEESGRWFRLPHAMVKPRYGAGLASVPAGALVAQATSSSRSMQ
jgi:hypothetical protein